MAGDITNEVLAERLSTVHDDLRDIKVDIAKLVSREVYDANREADRARIVALEKQVAAAEESRKQDAKAADERYRSLMRFLIGTVAVPILVLIVQVWMFTHGVVKP